jgi:hypothetical protein
VSIATAFDSTAPIDLPEASSVDKPNEEEFILPSLFEETEKFGAETQEVIVKRTWPEIRDLRQSCSAGFFMII